ncbi:hypothetical protein SLEP1_g35842 [Rubroshorea leprosula]|uniref:Uncharacterized protein n=1 Tax=Rubroshorea leprosula TaxID=152421 RepID=A0AAV5KQ19_9ROSI|nr:hypothetical protein SLEP1_g35842 [Rubroshorea leprosula]
MKGRLSKKTTKASASPSAGGDQPYAKELSSYKAACNLDVDLQTLDTTLQARTSCVISTLADGLEVRALSFDSLKEVTGCLLEMNQEVVKVILKCKEDVWKTRHLFELVEEYFDNSLQTLDFYNALEKCLQRARDSQLLILFALQQFEEETEVGGSRYVRTLEKLKIFKEAGDPFTEELYRMFQSVYKQQMLMLEKLQQRKNKLDKKRRRIKVWRKVSSMIFVTAFAAVVICSVVAAAMAAAPPVTAALAAASSSIPIGTTVGEWVDSLWKNCEDVLKWQKEVISSVQVGNYVAIKDLDNIRVQIDRLEIDIAALLQNADFAIEEEPLKIVMEEIKKKMGVFMKNAENLGAQADLCGCHIMEARNVVLQRIIKNPQQLKDGKNING